MASTKELILQTARDLFNQNGTAKITTNHIAKEAGISPGNLYYHYKDKSHIIRELYEQMIKDWEKPYDRIVGQDMSLEALETFIEDNFELLWQYRFFSRETVALLNADLTLFKRHVTISKKKFERQRLLLLQAEKVGILHFPGSTIQLDEVLTIAWIIANHYLIHLESMGQTVEQSEFQTGAKLVMNVLYPYLTEGSYR